MALASPSLNSSGGSG